MKCFKRNSEQSKHTAFKAGWFAALAETVISYLRINVNCCLFRNKIMNVYCQMQTVETKLCFKVFEHKRKNTSKTD